MAAIRISNLLKVAFIACLVISSVACSSKKGTGLGANKFGSGDSGSLTSRDLDLERDARFGEGEIPLAEAGSRLRDIFFGFDSSELSIEAQQDVDANRETVNGTEATVVLEGHTDERGTDEYNMALGTRRAQAVATYLSSTGINPSRLETISYGEHVPLNSGKSEEAFAQNRRVHFSLKGNR